MTQSTLKSKVSSRMKMRIRKETLFKLLMAKKKEKQEKSLKLCLTRIVW